MSMDFDGTVKRSVVCGGGLTKQSFKDGVNINSIVARYRKTGEFGSENGREPFFGDVSGVLGYQEACGVVIRAQALFDGLPSAVRERFMNEPSRLIAFLNDKSNLDEAVRLGIVSKRASLPAVVAQDGSGGLVPPVVASVPVVPAVPAG